MSTPINVTSISFPNGFSNYADQEMRVVFSISGLPKGQTPHVTFPAHSPAKSVTATGTDTWKASNTQTYEAQDYTMKIENAQVSFSVHTDGKVSDIKVG